MRLLNRWREWRVSRIEQRVAYLTQAINKLRLVAVQRGNQALDADAVVLEEERKRLWFQRSALIKKLPPIYEGDTPQ
jgi:hypothetical protein